MPKAKRIVWPPPPPLAAGEVALRTHDEGAFERAEAYRRRHKHPDEFCGPGNRSGSWRAIERINKVLAPCGRCGTLCAWPRVLRAALATSGPMVAPEHGCAAQGCSKAKTHKPARHAAVQRQWAAQLRNGARVLIARPSRIEQSAAQQLQDNALEAAIAAALTRLA